MVGQKEKHCFGWFWIIKPGQYCGVGLGWPFKSFNFLICIDEAWIFLELIVWFPLVWHCFHCKHLCLHCQVTYFLKTLAYSSLEDQAEEEEPVKETRKQQVVYQKTRKWRVTRRAWSSLQSLPRVQFPWQRDDDGILARWMTSTTAVVVE